MSIIGGRNKATLILSSVYEKKMKSLIETSSYLHFCFQTYPEKDISFF